jgi:hypothetical protein
MAASVFKHSQKENAENVYFASQQSDGQNTKRKRSYVADPIHQKRRTTPVTRQRSRLQTMCS